MMTSRWALVIATTIALAITLLFATRFGHERDLVARIRAHPPYVPRTCRLERLECGGTSRMGFRMTLPSNFSLKIEIPRARLVASFYLCNFSGQSVRVRVLIGLEDKKSARELFASPAIAPGDWQKMRVPLTGTSPGSVRLFFEARGDGGDVGWSDVQLALE